MTERERWLQSLAGDAAEGEMGGHAIEALDALGTEALRELWAEAVALVDELRPSIDRLADAILASPRLGLYGQEIHDALRGSDPP